MSKTDLGIHFFNSPEEAELSGHTGKMLAYGQQYIIATNVVIAEATRRSRELKDNHPRTIKGEIDDLIPRMIINMFAEAWQPPT
jgi:hypothetical protein